MSSCVVFQCAKGSNQLVGRNYKVEGRASTYKIASCRLVVVLAFADRFGEAESASEGFSFQEDHALQDHGRPRLQEHQLRPQSSAPTFGSRVGLTGVGHVLLVHRWLGE